MRLLCLIVLLAGVAGCKPAAASLAVVEIAEPAIVRWPDARVRLTPPRVAASTLRKRRVYIDATGELLALRVRLARAIASRMSEAGFLPYDGFDLHRALTTVTRRPASSWIGTCRGGGPRGVN